MLCECGNKMLPITKDSKTIAYWYCLTCGTKTAVAGKVEVKQ